MVVLLPSTAPQTKTTSVPPPAPSRPRRTRLQARIAAHHRQITDSRCSRCLTIRCMLHGSRCRATTGFTRPRHSLNDSSTTMHVLQQCR